MVAVDAELKHGRYGLARIVRVRDLQIEILTLGDGGFELGRTPQHLLVQDVHGSEEIDFACRRLHDPERRRGETILHRTKHQCGNEQYGEKHPASHARSVSSKMKGFRLH